MLKLNTIKFKGGESPKTDVLQAQIWYEQAEAQLSAFNSRLSRQRMRSAFFSEEIRDRSTVGSSLTEQPHFLIVPSGIPSTLLERRPDVRQAEMFLVSANANVGVAKAHSSRNSRSRVHSVRRVLPF